MISYINVTYLSHFISNSRCAIHDNNLFAECTTVYKNIRLNEIGCKWNKIKYNYQTFYTYDN